MFCDLQAFLNNVIEDEASKDKLACHDEVVPSCHIPQQLYSAEIRGGYDPTSRWELKSKPNALNFSIELCF